MKTAQLLANYQLAQMTHNSEKTDETKAALADAKEAYEVAAAKDTEAEKAGDAEKKTE